MQRWLALVGVATSQGGCYRTPGGPKACAGSLVGGAKVQEIAGWVKPGPGASASPLVGRAGS